jgi:hypothetical protein
MPPEKNSTRKPQFRNLADAPPDDDRLLIILDLTMLLLDLKDWTRQFEASILRLSRAERLAAPSVTPVYKRTAPPDSPRWDDILRDRG